jgi:L-rhamnose mutarotase
LAGAWAAGCALALAAADPGKRRGWAVCKPCHEPFSDRAPGEWWAGRVEVFPLD